jgi:hypothetical protein
LGLALLDLCGDNLWIIIDLVVFILVMGKLDKVDDRDYLLEFLNIIIMAEIVLALAGFAMCLFPRGYLWSDGNSQVGLSGALHYRNGKVIMKE